jgi:hypothetical protein
VERLLRIAGSVAQGKANGKDYVIGPPLYSGHLGEDLGSERARRIKGAGGGQVLAHHA